jgi:molecular chaperone DnaJ
MTTTTCSQCYGTGKIIESPCPECNGSGKVRKTKTISVKIPKGADTGLRLKVTGEGEDGDPGAPPGDLYVVIHVKPHSKFERIGDDIACELPISFGQAALGDSVKVSTLYGDVNMNIKPGTQTHSVLRLKGKGMPHLHGYGQGDQLVKVIVKTPTKLTKEQGKALAEYDRLSGGNAGNNKSGSVFDRVKDAFEFLLPGNDALNPQAE